MACRVGASRSTMGFWFAPAEDWASPPPYRLELAPSRRPGAMIRAGAGTRRRRRDVACALSRWGPDSPGRPAGRPRMALEVASRSARIEVDEAAWPEAREAGLLAVATCWRLEALDGALDRLTDDARMMLGRRGRTGPAAAGRRGPSWRALHHDGQALILELPEFEGPLTDPARFVPSREMRGSTVASAEGSACSPGATGSTSAPRSSRVSWKCSRRAATIASRSPFRSRSRS